MRDDDLEASEPLERIEDKLDSLIAQNINKNALDTIFANLKTVAINERSMRAGIARVDYVARKLGITDLYPHLAELLSSASMVRVEDYTNFPDLFNILSDDNIESYQTILISPAYCIKTDGDPILIQHGEIYYEPFENNSERSKSESVSMRQQESMTDLSILEKIGSSIDEVAELFFAKISKVVGKLGSAISNLLTHKDNRDRNEK